MLRYIYIGLRDYFMSIFRSFLIILCGLTALITTVSILPIHFCSKNLKQKVFSKLDFIVDGMFGITVM